MEEDDKGCPIFRMGVSGRMFLLVPAYPGSPGQKAVKRLCVCVFMLTSISARAVAETFHCRLAVDFWLFDHLTDNCRLNV